MPTIVTTTIGATGRDHTTVVAWESATDNDLVTADEVQVGEMYDDADFTSGVTITGATVDATRYRDLHAVSGEEYDPVADVGVVHALASPFIIAGEARLRFGSFGTISTGTSVSSIMRIQGANQLWTAMYVNVTTTTVSFSNAYNASSAGTDSQLRNCIGKGGDRVFQFSSAVVDCYNCISDGEYDGTPSVGRGYEGASTATINNCIGVNATSFDFHGSATEDYNASEDTSAAGANSITSQVVADMFNDQTAQDYRPATSGSNQIDDGVDLSGTFTESFEPGVSHNSGASGWEMGSYDDSATPAVPGGANEYLAAHAVRLSSNRRLRM